MLPYGVTAVEFALVTFTSAAVGIALVVVASRIVRSRYLAAFAVGVYLWYFTDTLGDANYLNVLNGPLQPVGQYSLLALFVVGLLVFFALDGKIFSVGEDAARQALAVGALAAVALGLHGFGEGADFGFTATQTHISTLLGAFGGWTEAASWVLHKALEPTIAAVAYVAILGSERRRFWDQVTDILGLAAVFVTPAVVGSAFGYYTTFDHTFVFALGLGASVYALAWTGKWLYSPGPAGTGLSVRMAVAALIGFLLIVLSALLHY